MENRKLISSVYFLLSANTARLLLKIIFSIGPLRSFDGFEISAERSGYVFLPIAGKFGHFTVQKLSELTLKVQYILVIDYKHVQ